MTFAEDLSLELAGRLTDHEFYGQNETYSARLSYSPVDYLTFRGTYGTSFRAPNARELFPGGQSGFVDNTDPCLVALAARSPIDESNPDLGFAYDPSQDARNQIVLDSCRAEGIDPTQLGLNIRPGSLQQFTAGNTGLDPETSTAFSYGFVFNQPWFNAFDATFSMNWFKIDVEDTIALPGAAFSLSECYNSPQFPNDPFCARRVPSGRGLFLCDWRWRQAAMTRATSSTRSRRWKGLDRTLASLGAAEPAFRATAAKPVMNMIFRPGSTSAARRASSMPSTPGMTMSVSSRSYAPGVSPMASRPSAPSATAWTSCPARSSALARNSRMEPSSSARRIRAIRHAPVSRFNRAMMARRAGAGQSDECRWRAP
jgi:hypothetical protein